MARWTSPPFTPQSTTPWSPFRGTHSPFAVTPTSPATDASQEAAAAAAAYGVLKGLFPNRSAQYQAA